MRKTGRIFSLAVLSALCAAALPARCPAQVTEGARTIRPGHDLREVCYRYTEQGDVPLAPPRAESTTGSLFLAPTRSPVPAAPRERGFFPPGLLRYELPRDGERYLGPYLGVGAALLLADERAIRAFDIEALLADRGRGNVQPAPAYRTFSRLGNPETLALTILGLHLLGGGRERAAAKVGGVALLNAAALTGALKSLTGKERPYQSGSEVRYHGPGLRYQAFPSGHASGTAALASVLAHYYPDGKPLWYALSAATGVSRIGMAMHWPSDVWFGWGVGILAGEGALRERDRIELWRFEFSF